MKKQIAAILCISGLILGGCGNAALAEQGTSMEQTESAQAESTNICAYVRAIQGDTIVVDPVQYISSEDGDKVGGFAAYGLAVYFICDKAEGAGG